MVKIEEEIYPYTPPGADLGEPKDLEEDPWYVRNIVPLGMGTFVGLTTIGVAAMLILKGCPADDVGPSTGENSPNGEGVEVIERWVSEERNAKISEVDL